jgi:hypothetical protein
MIHFFSLSEVLLILEDQVIYHRHSRWLEEAPLKGAINLFLVHPDSTDLVVPYQDLLDS